MKNYLIVGGNSGIGKEIVSGLLGTDSNIYTISRNGSGANHITGDVTDPNLKIDLSIDRLDGLVYCPGSINLKPLTSLKIEDFQNDLEVNYLGAVRVIKQLVNLLRKSENASVVLFSTVATKIGMNFHSSISGAKSAVEGLTKSLAAEYATKIRFNCIAPSLTETPLAGKLLANEKSRQMSVDRHPLKKIGEAKDVASLALWLLSENSKFVSGEIVKMDGGIANIK